MSTHAEGTDLGGERGVERVRIRRHVAPCAQRSLPPYAFIYMYLSIHISHLLNYFSEVGRCSAIIGPWATWHAATKQLQVRILCYKKYITIIFLYIHTCIYAYYQLKELYCWALLGNNWSMGYLARRYETVIGANNNLYIRVCTTHIHVYSPTYTYIVHSVYQFINTCMYNSYSCIFTYLYISG